MILCATGLKASTVLSAQEKLAENLLCHFLILHIVYYLLAINKKVDNVSFNRVNEQNKSTTSLLLI
jgi:hypothetical protein